MIKNKYINSISVHKRVNDETKNNAKIYLATLKLESDWIPAVYRLLETAYGQRKVCTYELCNHLKSLGLPVPEIYDIGNKSHYYYSLEEFIRGVELRKVYQDLTPAQLEAIGYRAGEVLKALHSIKLDDVYSVKKFFGMRPADWHEFFFAKAHRRIHTFENSDFYFADAKVYIKYIEHFLPLCKERPQTVVHSEYHIGNMLLAAHQEDLATLTPEALASKLQIIDFDGFDYGDPWEEFDHICWSAELAPEFAKGLVKGYFSGAEPPQEFWRLIALYQFVSILTHVVRDQDNLLAQDRVFEQIKLVHQWYPELFASAAVNFDNLSMVPTWYQ